LTTHAGGARAAAARHARSGSGAGRVVDAIDSGAVGFYSHFGFYGLAEYRLWRRIADIERALTG